jgi:glycine cleavage system H protein
MRRGSGAAPGAGDSLPIVIPEDLRYTDAHEWVRDLGDGVVRIGITDHAQSQLGDVVFVQLPTVGDEVTAGAAVGEVESTKSVSDIYVPVAGTVTAVNDALEANPELVNSGPYEAGWMLEVRLADGSGVPDDLLDAAAYRELVGS